MKGSRPSILNEERRSHARENSTNRSNKHVSLDRHDHRFHFMMSNLGHWQCSTLKCWFILIWIRLKINESLLLTPSQDLFTHPPTSPSPHHNRSPNLNKLCLIWNEPLWWLSWSILHHIFKSEATKIQDFSTNQYCNREILLRSPTFEEWRKGNDDWSYEGLYWRETNRLFGILRHVRIRHSGKIRKIQQHDL